MSFLGPDKSVPKGPHRALWGTMEPQGPDEPPGFGSMGKVQKAELRKTHTDLFA